MFWDDFATNTVETKPAAYEYHPKQPLFKGITGMVGNSVVFRMLRGKVVMASRPAKRKTISEKQEAYIERFREATQYAREQMMDPRAKAGYERGINARKHNAYTVAVADYLNAPVVEYIKAPGYRGAMGDIITIKATDDFKVVSVKVVIMSSEGVVVEQGEAVAYRLKKNVWKYKTAVANANSAAGLHHVSAANQTTIRVTAMDKPGNRGVGEVWV